MFTSEYLSYIITKYGHENPDLDSCQLLLNQLRMSDDSCPKCMTAQMLSDLLGGKKTVKEIEDTMSKASRYTSMLGLYNHLHEKAEEYRNDAKEAEKNNDTENVDEYRKQAMIYREKAETAWAMIQMAIIPLTQLRTGKDTFTWVVDIDRIY